MFHGNDILSLSTIMMNHFVNSISKRFSAAGSESSFHADEYFGTREIFSAADPIMNASPYAVN
jgi:hypothetical protein